MTQVGDGVAPVAGIVGARPNYTKKAPIMLGLLSGATVVLTDSGGMQEETTALGVPCLTVRENTERPIIVEQGTNTMVGGDADAILGGVEPILSGEDKGGRTPEYWDGLAAERIASHLSGWLAARVPNNAPAEAT